MILGHLVKLVGIEKEHLEKIKSWRNDPTVYDTLFENDLLTSTHQDRWYASLFERSDVLQLLITTIDNEPIGIIGFFHINRRNRSAEWGFYIGDSAYRFGGFAAEAEFLLLDYGFNHLNFHRIWCHTFSFNKHVLSMHKRFYFHQEGILRESAYHKGKYEDVVVMSLLKKEFDLHRAEWLTFFSKINPSR